MTGATSLRVPRRQWRAAGVSEDLGSRAVPEEVPVAFTYRGCSYAVMMATPADLEDFAHGFSRSEGLISTALEITAIEIRSRADGGVVDIDLAPAALDRFWERRRFLAGPSGCGLCGIESIGEALRPVPRVPRGCAFAPEDIAAAMAALPRHQPLGRETRAVHAAALWQPSAGILALREDIGRHNALDKLIGAAERGGIAIAASMLLLTSRISVELIQKAAMAGATVVVAISAPTALAIRTAEGAGMTLIGIARDDGFEIFTEPSRIAPRRAADAA